MKGSCTKPVFFTCTILLILIVAQENRVAAVDPCNPAQLSPCLETIMKGSEPSDLCCSKVKEQQHCICQYLKNPNFKSFLNSPNAKIIATDCHCPYPKC
ncbi:putative bifunctional inhibitor/plant lipid transfer protein/seed storage helical [Arabidopsis thaliana]|uniref:Bifunctional inhibitor/lipid-transfer protein/seed storage 2S albumin superfamily protein n=4 Tax=Arabidopsis TaxID=3701 RepID=Q9C9T4_ARATH|nr:Bifunctional inhibitor/lipid-transfer protein/seed storage 2S albumin superfamily protein [Arabidopsis thaliana]KAG7651605.1 Bifunctional inhibitor/plant lipid transfer protein/seed storage helical domain [Arabidopsis thaliana x Arabidopsis arenosa]KAG7659468.1 Bifunctional inhibitor/plant lipid transfer protein/seed storage helical domain [Arabidopsis suecica]AAG52085.1 putative lipid transfer protein; 71816-72112 [Arabidopsis thaliana]AEE35508.1 Bifunctional inhibitor/lipid-transfer protei|eukprot:NP_001319377.1 Bifunctional inhibitor/lipid-transfer protein/seed storage 2S albumin superfamily protein [Arabidopsis thaliana]